MLGRFKFDFFPDRVGDRAARRVPRPAKQDVLGPDDVSRGVRLEPTDFVDGNFYCGKNDYAAFWTTLQRLLPRWKGKEYGLPARPGVFLVYSSRGIVNSRG
jgi:hypothetical protein